SPGTQAEPGHSILLSPFPQSATATPTLMPGTLHLVTRFQAADGVTALLRCLCKVTRGRRMRFVSDSRPLVPILGMALLLALPLGVSAADAGHGSLDPSFGKGGIVTTAVGPWAA